MFIWILNTGNYSVRNHNSFIMYMCDYLPYYQQCERYRYTDMFLSLYFHVILLSPPRVGFFSPGHARSSTSWNEHYCLSCLKYRSLKAESHLSFHCISDKEYNRIFKNYFVSRMNSWMVCEILVHPSELKITYMI